MKKWLELCPVNRHEASVQRVQHESKGEANSSYRLEGRRRVIHRRRLISLREHEAQPISDEKTH